MNIRSNLLFPRASVAALALAASLLSLGATSAKAQFLFSWRDRAVSPMQVERMVEASGYRLTGPVMRNGPVYLANVLGRENDRERLVIDARDGRLLQRYSAEARRQYAAEGDWASRPRPRDYRFDGWFDHEDDSLAPRPPVDVYGDSESGLPHGPFVRLAPQSSQVARTEDPAARSGAAADSSDPYVILAPPDVAHASDKAKAKPQVRHKKPEPTPVAQPAANPADSKPSPVAAQPPANSQPTTNPQAAVNPDAMTPAASTPRVADIKQEPSSPPPAANPPAAITAPVAMPARPISARQPAPAPRVADTKPVAASAPEIVPAASPAPQPKPARPKPALNDVPVAPLE